MATGVPSMKAVLLEMAQEHERRARVYEQMAAEGRTFLDPQELIERAHVERIQSARAAAVAEDIRF